MNERNEAIQAAPVMKRPQVMPPDEQMDLAMNQMVGHLETIFTGYDPDEIEWIAHYLAIEILAAHLQNETTY